MLILSYPSWLNLRGLEDPVGIPTSIVLCRDISSYAEIVLVYGRRNKKESKMC